MRIEHAMPYLSVPKGWDEFGQYLLVAEEMLRREASRRGASLGYRLTVQRSSVTVTWSTVDAVGSIVISARACRSGVAVTQERLDATMKLLRRCAERGRAAPTNKQIALIALKLGTQRYQSADRTLGIKWPKCEHGAVIIAELERRGLVTVVRGRNWRTITIVETGQVLGRRTPRLDGSSWQRQFRGELAAA